MQGGKGRDSLWGGRGNDFLVGGNGDDDFWFDTRNGFDIVNDFRAGDELVIDVEDGGFEGVRRSDLFIDSGPKFDKLYVDGDYVAKVYGDVLFYSDIRPGHERYEEPLDEPLAERGEQGGGHDARLLGRRGAAPAAGLRQGGDEGLGARRRRGDSQAPGEASAEISRPARGR